MSNSGGFVTAAMRDAAIAPLDERGLMPLDEARALVRSASEFRKGRGRMRGGSWVLDSDILWAALISLEETAEFVREASRIRWFFHPRGNDNTAPLDRYGEGILPWLATFVRPDGRFVDVPWCVRPCLLRIARREVFNLLWRVTCVADGIGDEWPGPFAADNAGDADRRSGTRIDDPGAATPDDDANFLVLQWIETNPRAGFPELAQEAEAGDARARLMLMSLAQCSPRRAFDHVRAALGDDRAMAIFTASRAPTELTDWCILVSLDAGVEAGWPELFAALPERAYHALRLVAVRAREGDGWGVAFERVEGDAPDTAVVRRYLYGSEVESGPREVDASLPFTIDGDDERASPFDLDGVRVYGPKGPLDLATSMVAQRDLRPGRATAEGVASSRFALMLRAYLAEYPDAFWSEPREVAAALGLGDDAEVLVVSAAFEHTQGVDGPGASPAEWKVKPSQSPVFRSLARALVARDASEFEPGEPNLDFRLHALADTGEAMFDA